MANQTTSSVFRISADSTQAIQAMQQFGVITEESMLRIIRATDPANRSIEQLDRSVGGMRDQLRSAANSIAVLDGPLGGIASRINALATTVGRVGVAWAAATIALSGLTFGLIASVRAASQYEQSQFRLEQIIRATGSAAGFTAREIDQMSRGIAESTMATSTGVRDAAQILLTFKTIQNSTFRDTLKTAQDMSATFGQSLTGAVTMLGKALEDPIRGLSALSEVGVSFTATEREMVKSLQESGRLLEAQKLIREAINRQVGGAGVAEAQGPIGEMNKLGQAFRNLAEHVGEATGAAKAWEETLIAQRRIVTGIDESLFPDDFFTRIERAKTALEEAKRLILESQNLRTNPELRSGIVTPDLIAPPDLTAAEDRLFRERQAQHIEIVMQEENALTASAAALQRTIDAENERAASIQEVLDALQLEINLVGKSVAEKELAIARSKDMKEANDEEATSFMRFVELREAALAAEDRRTGRLEFAESLEMEAGAIGASNAAKRIAIQLAGDYRDATVEMKNAMIDGIIANERANDAREREIELKKLQAADTKVIDQLEQEIALRMALSDAERRSIQTFDKFSDIVDPKTLADAERLLSVLEELDRRDVQAERANERAAGVERAREFVRQLQLENEAFSQSEAQARQAAALQGELAGAGPNLRQAGLDAIALNEQLLAQDKAREEGIKAQEQALEVVADLEREIAAIRQSPAEQALAEYLRQAGVEAGETANRIRELVPQLLELRKIQETAPRPRDKGQALDEMAMATNEETKASLRDNASAMNDLVNAIRPGAEAAREFRSEVALLNSTIGQEMLQAAGVDHAEAMRHLRMQYIDTSNVMVQTMHHATSSIASSFAQMVKGVRISIAELATDLAAFAVQTGLQQALTFGVNSFLGSTGFGSTIAAGPDVATSSSTGGTVVRQMHYGGMVNDLGGPNRLVSPSLFVRAPRYHNGLGLADDEMPAILQRGERVIPKGQSAGGPQEVRIKVVGDPNGGDEVTELNEPGAGKSFQLMLRNSTLQTLAGKEARMMMARMYGLRSRTR